MILETPRLILRVPTDADRPGLHAIWADPQVMADLGPVKDAAASDVTLAKHDGYRHEGLGFWAVVHKADGAVIGFCGLKRGEGHTPIAGEVEAGWTLGTPWWGQGFAYEAMEASLAWAWANTRADRIFAITSARNAKSRRLMDRLGMIHLPELDYESATYVPGDPLRPSVAYVIERPVA